MVSVYRFSYRNEITWTDCFRSSLSLFLPFSFLPSFFPSSLSLSFFLSVFPSLPPFAHFTSLHSFHNSLLPDTTLGTSLGIWGWTGFWTFPSSWNMYPSLGHMIIKTMRMCFQLDGISAAELKQSHGPESDGVCGSGRKGYFRLGGQGRPLWERLPTGDLDKKREPGSALSEEGFRWGEGSYNVLLTQDIWGHAGKWFWLEWRGRQGRGGEGSEEGRGHRLRVPLEQQSGVWSFSLVCSWGSSFCL